MNKTKKELSDRRQELLDKKVLSKVISDWAGENKKAFWKYEVSSFYKTYLIKLTNLPEPSVNDIQPLLINKLLNEQQKKQLCAAIAKAAAKATVFNGPSIDFQIDYVDGIVVAEVV